jgi:hypothetical protein
MREYLDSDNSMTRSHRLSLETVRLAFMPLHPAARPTPVP